MKQSIEWHENCLKNQKSSLKRDKEKLERLASDYQKSYNETKFYEFQIEEAKKINKDRFDSERFRVKKK